jgi:uncharacterized GH25 family protein
MLRRYGPMLVGVVMAVGRFASVPAHDFWIQPDQYWLAPQSVVPLTLQVGHGPSRQRSPIPLNRITRFEAIAPNGSAIDLRGDLHPGGHSEDGQLRLQQPGTYVLVLQTDGRAQSHVAADRFNDYLREEGLTPALEERERDHRMDTDGSESYSRVAKSIVQVGLPGEVAETSVTRPLGLPLEIVPERNPYERPRPASLSVRVLYHGQPLSGALLKLTDVAQDAEPFEVHLTDRSGRATFAMPMQGMWRLNVIWTQLLPASRETDFETVFSSLSFGFP